jgi:hypothetical protein
MRGGRPLRLTANLSLVGGAEFLFLSNVFFCRCHRFFLFSLSSSFCGFIGLHRTRLITYSASSSLLECSTLIRSDMRACSAFRAAALADLATRAAARASSCFCVITRLGCCCADRATTEAVSAVTAAVSVPVSGGVGAGAGSLYVGSVLGSLIYVCQWLVLLWHRKYYFGPELAAVDTTPPPVRLWLDRSTR